jgi:glycosyltransferase involved in cell wall biosynthesis
MGGGDPVCRVATAVTSRSLVGRRIRDHFRAPFVFRAGAPTYTRSREPTVHTASGRVVRVVIDARPAMPQARTGVGSYTWQLIRRLPRADPHATFVAWYLDVRAALRLERRAGVFADVGAPNLVERRMPFPSRWFDRVAMRLDVPRIEWMVRSDVVFAPNFVPPPTRSRRVVLTVHDLAFKRYPETAPMATRRWLARLESSLRTASQVIVVSEQTRRDLLDSYPGLAARLAERLTVVPLGVDTEDFRPVEVDAVDHVRRRFGVAGPFLLSLGGIEPRKNLPALIRAYASLPDGLRPALVIAGPVAPWNPEGWNLVRPALEALPAGVRDHVVVTGYVSDEEKVALLAGAEALVYPSLYEGFGLPVIEAMACGTPVLTSNLSALPETAGDAALLVDPHSVEGIAAGIERLLTDSALRERLRSAGFARAGTFSWEETARRTAEVLRRGSG